MKDSKEKEHRISNLKDMIHNVKDDGSEYEEIEEDSELIDYLNEDTLDYTEMEIDDEFIFRPGEEDDYAVNLEENPIDEDYLIKTPKEGEIKEDDEIEDFGEDLVGDVSQNFDNIIHAKVGGKPLLAIISSILGAILIILSIFILDSRSDRVIDNVVAGESSFMFVIFFIVGFLLLLYGVIKIFNVKNPFESLTKSIDSIDSDDDDTTKENEEPSAKKIPESNIPLDKDSYKIGEFEMDDLKKSLKKPTPSKNQDSTENLEKPSEKGLSEYEKAQLENESIDEIFSDVEGIEDVPIISNNSKEEK